ncbi:hypothetical protein ACWCXB_31195 [Streptomyces sp. NPDC001514]
MRMRLMGVLILVAATLIGLGAPVRRSSATRLPLVDGLGREVVLRGYNVSGPFNRCDGAGKDLAAMQ